MAEPSLKGWRLSWPALVSRTPQHIELAGDELMAEVLAHRGQGFYGAGHV